MSAINGFLTSLKTGSSANMKWASPLTYNYTRMFKDALFLRSMGNTFLYADLYDIASFESKKMIVSQLIRRVDVYRGYQIHVDFNFDLAQYLENSDELAC